MNTLEYFMAHAPKEPQPWFEPVMETKEPKQSDFQSIDYYRQSLGYWNESKENQRLLQWPLAWAKEMVKRIPVQQTDSEDKPFYIDGVGWVTLTENPTGYDVNMLGEAIRKSDSVIVKKTMTQVEAEEIYGSDAIKKTNPQRTANWSRGKTGGCIVSDVPNGIVLDGAHDIGYYGGHLVGESMSEACINLILEMKANYSQNIPQTKSVHYDPNIHGSAITEEPRFEDLLKFVVDQKNLPSNSPYNKSMFGWLENALLDVKNFLGRP